MAKVGVAVIAGTGLGTGVYISTNKGEVDGLDKKEPVFKDLDASNTLVSEERWSYRNSIYEHYKNIFPNGRYLIEDLGSKKISDWCEEHKNDAVKKDEFKYWCYERDTISSRIPNDKQWKDSTTDFITDEDGNGKALYERMVGEFKNPRNREWLSKNLAIVGNNYHYAASYNWCEAAGFIFYTSESAEEYRVFMEYCVKTKQN